MANLQNITGIKRVAREFYAIVDNGEKEIQDSSFSDKGDTVLSYKAVSNFSLVGITIDEAMWYFGVARESGVLPEEMPDNNAEVWIVSFTDMINKPDPLQAENATLKAQLATLQEAHATTVSYMSQEVARLQEELDEWNEMAVTPKQYMEELEARDDEVLTLKAKLMLSKAYVSEFARVGAKKTPITYEVYISPSFSLEVTSRNGWRATGYSVKFATAVDVMKWYIETYMNGEIPKWMISNG